MSDELVISRDAVVDARLLYPDDGHVEVLDLKEDDPATYPDRVIGLFQADAVAIRLRRDDRAAIVAYKPPTSHVPDEELVELARPLLEEALDARPA